MSVSAETVTPRPVRLDLTDVSLNGDLALPKIAPMLPRPNFDSTSHCSPIVWLARSIGRKRTHRHLRCQPGSSERVQGRPPR
jgi:hypothetical protein